MKLPLVFYVFTFTMLTKTHLSAQTSLLWSETAGTSASTQKSFVATDLLGNIYMASAVNGTYGLDWKVSSWRPDSVSRWTYLHNGSGNLDDIPAGIVVDSAFNVYISGTSRSSGSKDIKMIKLDSAGNYKWGVAYNRTGSAHDVGTGMAVWGNRIYLCGHSQQSTGNYDYTVLKYDTAGTLLWSRHANGSGSGDDYSTSIAVKTGGSDIYVTGNAVITGGTRDMMTLRYSTDGTLQWTKYYGNTTGQNDYGNAIGINYSGDIIVTGQSYVTGTNSNLTTIKYSGSSGAQAWAASYAGTYGGHDASYSVVIDPDNYFYVTGYTQVGSSNTDYVTIKYKGNGSVTWAQTYNGPGNGADEACAVIRDGYDIVVTGKSTGSGSGPDVCTISMDKVSGAVNWTMRVTSVSSGADCGYSLARDEMGNVYVAYNSPVSSGYSNSCLRYFQKDKNDTAIAKCLEVIAAGFSDLKTDTVFKRVIWYNILRGYDDSIYLMYADALRALGDAAGVSATTKISAKIATTYSWNSSYNWAVITSKRMWNGYGKVKPLMGIPKLYQFSKSGFISSNTNTAFTHLEYDYPVGCVTCGDKTLDTSDITGKAAWVFFVNLPPFIFYPRTQVRPFINCWVGHPTLFPIVCEVCPAMAQVSYPVTAYGGTGHHEIGISVLINDETGNCLDNIMDVNGVDSMSQAEMDMIYYARLQALPNGVYWSSYTSGLGYATVQRSYEPHIGDLWSVWRPAITLTNEITLCSFHAAEFHETGEASPRYSMDQGGVYRVWRPDISTLPAMYFYASPFYGMTFIGGPDMNLKYAAEYNDSTCTNGNYSFSPTCEIENSIMGAHSTTQLIGDSSAFDLFATADSNMITNYWLNNAITVGFSPGQVNSGPALNVVEFYADTTGSTCDPLTYPDVDTIIAELFCFTSNIYEVNKSFYSSITIPSGADLLIHVEVNYKNGESINQCQYFTINANVTSVSAVGAIIRGDIKDYSSAVDNYHITIYSTTP